MDERNEKNKRIAVDIMGWTKGENELYWFNEKGAIVIDQTYFDPMTVISDAWLAVERMQELNFLFSMDMLGGQWGVEFWHDDWEPKAQPGTTFGKSAAKAICEAALIAMEIRMVRLLRENVPSNRRKPPRSNILRETILSVLKDVHIETGRTDDFNKVVGELELAISELNTYSYGDQDG